MVSTVEILLTKIWGCWQPWADKGADTCCKIRVTFCSLHSTKSWITVTGNQLLSHSYSDEIFQTELTSEKIILSQRPSKDILFSLYFAGGLDLLLEVKKHNSIKVNAFVSSSTPLFPVLKLMAINISWVVCVHLEIVYQEQLSYQLFECEQDTMYADNVPRCLGA